MKRLIAIAAVGILASLMATPVLAVPATFGDGGVALQNVLNGITTGPNAGVSSVNVLTDAVGNDSTWAIGGTGQSGSTLIFEGAGFANDNTFGIYDLANPANRVQIFDGPAGGGDQAVVAITAAGAVYLNGSSTGVTLASGNNFGFYLDTPDGDFFSNTALNADGIDHMYAYQGTGVDTVQILPWAPGVWQDNEYVLGWEDLYGGGDGDYEDFVVMVESITPVVPAPGAILLGSIGTCLVGWLRKKRAL